MNRDKEAKLLTSLIEKIESDNKSILTRLWFNPLLWIVCAISFMAAFQLYKNYDHPLILVIASSLVGIFVGVISILQVSEKNWHVLKVHINKDSLVKRVNDINT